MKLFFSKTKTFILTHKVVVIILVVILTTTAVVTTSGMLPLNNSTKESQTTTTKEPTSEEITTLVETTTEESTEPDETTTEASTEPPTPAKLVPLKNIDIKTTYTKVEEEKTDPEASKPREASPVVVDMSKLPIYENSNITYGIDVSHHQGVIDWGKVKASGVKFAIIRVGYRSISDSGTIYIDRYFEQNIKGALANGIQVGAYFFSQATSVAEAVEEASTIIQYLKPYKITYPVTFDWEGYNISSYRVYSGKNNYTSSSLNEFATAFCDLVKANGYTPMVYASKSYFNNNYFNNSLLSNKYKIWLAHYTSRGLDTPTDYRGTYQMWQFCSDGRVDGISGNVDMNVAYFGYAGSQVSNTPIKLNIPNTSLSTIAGTPLSLLNGVSASDTLGTDISSKVTVTIKNNIGQSVDEDTAFNTPGEYVLTYKITDFTGGTKSANANLIVSEAETTTELTAETGTAQAEPTTKEETTTSQDESEL